MTYSNQDPKELAASRPSPFTIHHFLAYLTRTLITKTGESPSVVNRHVRKLYGVVKPFDVDHPGHLQELIERIDKLERDRSTVWYLAQARKEILTFRHELEQAQRHHAMPQPPRDVHAEHAGQVRHTAQPIGQMLMDFS